MADVVVRLEAGNAQKLLDSIPEGTIHIASDGYRELRDHLRAALDSPPVEERVEYRVVGHHCRTLYYREVELGRAKAMAEYLIGRKQPGVHIERRFVVTSPWTDLPSEEGEPDGE